MLHPTRASQHAAVNHFVRRCIEIDVIRLEPKEPSYKISEPDRFDVIRLQMKSEATMLIDAEGCARLTDPRQSGSYSPRYYAYVTARKWHIENPFNQPVSKLTALYEEALHEVWRDQVCRDISRGKKERDGK